MRAATTFAVIACVVMASAGCNSSDGRLKVQKVRTKVYYEGKALGGAFVVLHPADAQNGVRSFGVTQPDGTLQLTTYDANDGAPAGDYLVTIEWRQPPSSRDEENPLTRPNLLASRYANPTTSGLRVNVTPGVEDVSPLKLSR